MQNNEMQEIKSKKRVILSKMLEGVLIPLNSSKHKTVADNAILLNRFISSENISESIKIKIEFDFHLKRNVCKFRRNKNRQKNSRTADSQTSFAKSPDPPGRSAPLQSTFKGTVSYCIYTL